MSIFGYGRVLPDFGFNPDAGPLGLFRNAAKPSAAAGGVGPMPPAPMPQPAPPQSPAAQGWMDKLKGLGGNPLFMFGMNLLAQDGYDTMPGPGPMARIARAGLATHGGMAEQAAAARQAELEEGKLGIDMLKAYTDLHKANQPEMKVVGNQIVALHRNGKAEVVHQVTPEKIAELEQTVALLGVDPKTPEGRALLERIVLKQYSPDYQEDEQRLALERITAQNAPSWANVGLRREELDHERRKSGLDPDVPNGLPPGGRIVTLGR